MKKLKCDHDNALVYYPGEITTDKQGRVREDGMRVFCEDCGIVIDWWEKVTRRDLGNGLMEGVVETPDGITVSRWRTT